MARKRKNPYQAAFDEDQAAAEPERSPSPATTMGRFSRLPAAAVFDGRVSLSNLRVLAALAVYADQRGECWPAVSTIAARLGVGRRNVQYQLRQLEALRYITTIPQTRTRGGSASNRYAIAYPAVPDLPAAGGAATSPAETDQPPLSGPEIENEHGAQPDCAPVAPEAVDNDDTARRATAHRGAQKEGGFAPDGAQGHCALTAHSLTAHSEAAQSGPPNFQDGGGKGTATVIALEGKRPRRVKGRFARQDEGGEWPLKNVLGQPFHDEPTPDPWRKRADWYYRATGLREGWQVIFDALDAAQSRAGLDAREADERVQRLFEQAARRMNHKGVGKWLVMMAGDRQSWEADMRADQLRQPAGASA